MPRKCKKPSESRGVYDKIAIKIREAPQSRKHWDGICGELHFYLTGWIIAMSIIRVKRYIMQKGCIG